MTTESNRLSGSPRPLSPMENFCVGAGVGAFEVYSFGQPFTYFKVESQKHRGTEKRNTAQLISQLIRNFQIRQLYAGATANAFGMALITGIQIGIKGYCINSFSKEGTRPLTEQQKLMAAFWAGLFGAPVASFSELVMDVHREKTKRISKPKYTQTIYELFKNYGAKIVYRGLLPTALRDAGFTIGYGYLGPAFKDQLKERGIKHDKAAAIGGGVLAGVIGTLITHPFDTWKTRVQAQQPVDFWPGGLKAFILNAYRKSYSQTGKATTAMESVVKQALKEPYRGVLARGGRVTVAVTLFNILPEYVAPAIQNMTDSFKKS